MLSAPRSRRSATSERRRRSTVRTSKGEQVGGIALFVVIAWWCSRSSACRRTATTSAVRRWRRSPAGTAGPTSTRRLSFVNRWDGRPVRQRRPPGAPTTRSVALTRAWRWWRSSTPTRRTPDQERSLDPDPPLLRRRPADGRPDCRDCRCHPREGSRGCSGSCSTPTSSSSRRSSTAPSPVTSDDRKFASAVLHPRTMEGLLGLPRRGLGHPWRRLRVGRRRQPRPRGDHPAV